MARHLSLVGSRLFNTETLAISLRLLYLPDIELTGSKKFLLFKYIFTGKVTELAKHFNRFRGHSGSLLVGAYWC
jgi:hypothetical protein